MRNIVSTASIASPEPCDLSQVTGRIYVASSLSTYDTPRYARELERIRALFPHADILPARDQFTSNEQWRRGWPEILRTLQAVVFFADDDGYIGFGVWTELTAALDRDIPIRYLASNGHLHEISADDGEIETTAFRPWDLRQFAMIAYKVSAIEALGPLRSRTKGGD